jgi:hypothetical protein
MPYVRLQEKAEEPKPVTHYTLSPEEGQQWLADLLRRTRANAPLRRGKRQPGKPLVDGE